MRAMWLEGADPALLIAEQHDLFAQQLSLLWQISQLVRGADRLPISSQQLTHRAPRLDACQFEVWLRCLPSIRRFHHCLPRIPGSTISVRMQAPAALYCQQRSPTEWSPTPQQV